MALQTLSKTNILNGNVVQAADVSQSVDAFTGAVGYAIVLSGSFTFAGQTTGSGYFANAVAADTVRPQNVASNIGYTIPYLASTGSTSVLYYSATGPTYNPTTQLLTATASQAVSASQAASSSYTQYGTNNLTYGAFSDRTTQTVSANTSASLTFNTTDLANGVNIGSPSSRLVVTKTGIYNLQFSVQISISSGANGNAYLWLRKNGTNQTYTNTGVYLQNANDKHVAAWNFVLSLNAGDYLELVMWAQGADIQALTETPIPGTGPTGNGNVGVPSIIATLTQIT